MQLSRLSFLASLAICLVALSSCTRQVASKHHGEEAETDSPDQAIEWMKKSWVDENGRIPAHAWDKARSQIAALASSRAWPSDGTWQEVGPYNVSGRARSFVIHPTDPAKMWLGTVGGGIWKTTDAGATWAPVNDKLPNLSIGCLVIDQTNPNSMYAGTGEGWWNSDAIQGSGILKSTDGGTNWSVLANTTAFQNINRIAISPTNSSVLLAAVQPGGVYRSTDAGTTWTQVITTDTSYGMGASVAFDPSNGSKAVAVTRDANFTAGDYEYKARYSTDGGATWTDATGLTKLGFGSRIELAYSKSVANSVYAVQDNGSGIQVLKSTDGGKTYTLKSSGLVDGGQSWYDLCLWVDPTNDATLVFGGVYFYKSTNSGVSSTQISGGYILTDNPHPDTHFLVSDPRFNGTSHREVYGTTDGGLFKAPDIYAATTTSGWFQAAPTARSTQFYSVSGHGATGRILGGLQDNGTLQIESASTNLATMEFGGDGGFTAIDPTNPSYLYGEYIYLMLHRSTDAGVNANYIYSGITDASNQTANFIAPFILDPSNANTMLAGGSRLWRSTNVKAASPTWTSIKAASTDYISSIAVANSNSSIIWVGHNDGKVFKSTNGTSASPTWTAISGLPGRYVGRILIDRTNPQTVWIGFGGFNAGNLYVTHDGGSTWASASGSGATALPSAPIHALAQDPNNAANLFVGTEVGVCASTDSGANWSASTKGPLNVAVYDLQYMSGTNKLLAATHGRGVWLYTSTAFSGWTLPTNLGAGKNVNVTINLNGMAMSDTVVNLTSSDANLVLPASVTIPAGSTSAVFNIRAKVVITDTPATVTATYGSQTLQGTVTITKPTFVMGYSTGAVVGGSSTSITGKIVFSTLAPRGGYVVTLESVSPSAVSVPSTVTIPMLTTTATFPVTHYAVGKTIGAKVNVTWQGVTGTKTLVVYPASPSGLTFDKRTLVGGTTPKAVGTVTITNPAPAGGTTVWLSSSDTTAATVPSTVTVPQGMTSTTFNVTTNVVAANKVATISAWTGLASTPLKTITSTVTVIPPRMYHIDFSPDPVKGGSNVTCTLTLDGVAPAGGSTVTLSVDKTAVATVPSTLTIPAGAKSATVTITTKSVASTSTVTLTAICGLTKTKAFTVNP